MRLERSKLASRNTGELDLLRVFLKFFEGAVAVGGLS